MKTSKPQQEQTRRQLIRAAVELMTEHGYEATTMKQIARACGLGDATIYKYFPTKDKLLLDYFELSIEAAIVDLRDTPDLDQFTLHEKLQRLVDALLETLEADREFVAICRAVVGKSPLLVMRDALPGQQALKQEVVAMLELAEGHGEIAPCEFRTLIGGWFADYLFALIVYWLNDDSDEFSDTTQLVDLTLALLVTALKSGIVNKLSDLAGFMLRSQMSRLMQNGSGLLDLVKLARRHVNA